MGRPFTVILLFFVMGILLSRVWMVDLSLGIIFIIVSILLLAMEFMKKGSILWMGLLLTVFGFVVYQYQFPTTSIMMEYKEELPPIEVQVTGKSMIRYNNKEVEVRILKINSAENYFKINEKAKLIIRNGDSTELLPGDVVVIHQSKIKKQFNSRDLKGYELYLRGKGICYELVTNGEYVNPVTGNQRYSPLYLSFKIKDYVETFFDKSLQKPQQEIMKSVLFGNQGYLSLETKTAFSRSGTAHMVAVSGLHIGIIVLILEKLLKLLKIRRNNRLIFIGVGVVVYGFIVGFPVSIIRAGAMYILYVLAYFLDRRYDSINCLMLIAFITLIFNPLNLFSVAFQLSFSATYSILLLYPLLNNIPIKIPKSIKSLLMVTMAAQLGTAPIIAFHFNEISIISLLVNLFIIPTLGVLLTLGLVSVFVNLISLQLGMFINYFTNGLLTYIYWIVDNSSRWTYSSIQVQQINGVSIFLYYTLLIIIYYLLTSGKHLWDKESWRKDELSKNSKQH